MTLLQLDTALLPKPAESDRDSQNPDVSVMPSIVRGNTNAAVLAIAEKAAEILLANDLAENGD